MHVIADISIVPLGVGLSLSPYIAACERVLAEAGLEPRLHAYGSNVEGEWDEVFAALRRCHEVLHEKQSGNDKIRSVQDKLDTGG
jgi:uncharacterized protein (TIGR00106 family)